MMDTLIYDGWLKLYKREIEGRSYEIVDNLDAVSILVLNEFNDVLVVKQFRPAVMAHTLEIPAGTLDIQGESPEDCASRELLEETNLIIDGSKLEKIICYKPMMGFSNSTMNIFKISVKKRDLPETSLKDEDVLSVQWLPFRDFSQLIQRGEISDGKTVMAYYYMLANVIK